MTARTVIEAALGAATLAANSFLLFKKSAPAGKEAIKMAFKDWLESKVKQAVTEICTRLEPAALHLIPGVAGTVLSAIASDPQVQTAEEALLDSALDKGIEWGIAEGQKFLTWLQGEAEKHFKAQIDALASVTINWGSAAYLPLLHALQSSTLAGTVQADLAKVYAALGLPAPKP